MVAFSFVCLGKKIEVFSEIYIYTNLYELEAKRCYIVFPSTSLCYFLELGICQHITWPWAGLVLPEQY